MVLWARCVRQHGHLRRRMFETCSLRRRANSVYKFQANLLEVHINSSERIALEELKAELIKQAGCLSRMSWDFGLVGLAKCWVKGCPWLPHVYPPFVWSWVRGRERELLWFCREKLACSLGERSFKIQYPIYPRKLLCWLPSIHYFVRFSAKFAHIFQIVDDCNKL